MSLLDRRVLIVTGKGGTGKTTTAAALGLWGARTGRATLIVECNGTRHIGPLFRQPAGTYAPQQLHPRLFGMSITSDEAIEDYVVKQIKVRKLYSMVFRNRVMTPFMDAVPGLHDAVHLGKVYDLTEDDMTDGKPTWDLVIVDAPSTGHGLHLLNAPASMMALTRRGPVYNNVKLVQDVIADGTKTGIVLTCLPEDMPVNETIELHKQLGTTSKQVGAVVLNQILKPDLPPRDQWPETEAFLNANSNPGIAQSLAIVNRFHAREIRQRRALEALSSHIDAPVVEFPYLLDRSIAFTEIDALSRLLEQALGGS
jgi:anion-transporting  ArsA/GET3 family ATPase